MDASQTTFNRPNPAECGTKIKEEDTSSHGSPEASDLKLAHTLSACTRCRKRKSRCDPGLPRCGPCERHNATCEYFDVTKNKKVSRTYVIYLQDKIKTLESELAQIVTEEPTTPDAETIMRGAGLVRFKENDESRYLGPSSGIALTRLVMELAKQNTSSKCIKEIVPDMKAQQIKDFFTRESSKPTSKVYPLISNVAAPDLPSRELTENLIENFNHTAQYLLPTLHEPSFHKDVEDVYRGSLDAYKNFILRMVIAISMQKLDTKFAGLADSYYLAALPFLAQAMKPMNLGTLQCFALIAQYSLVTPTRTASYWVVGVATRLCQELGISEEATIELAPGRPPLDPLEIDMRRRLFWIITSMEMGLAHSLGRPSALGASFDHIDVKFFMAVDDCFITSSGVATQSRPSNKKYISRHFMKMRLLQAEMRRKLYLKKRPQPKDDQDPWFITMQQKLDNWLSASPKDEEGNGLNEIWFRGRFNIMTVMLHRPSPQIPEPSVASAQICFNAASFNIGMHRQQIATESVDLTWIFTQSLFMALNTVLWSISYAEVRTEHSKSELEKLLRTAQEGIYLAAERWPGVESALALYGQLGAACLKAYDYENVTFRLPGPSSTRPWHGGSQVVHQQPKSTKSSSVATSSTSSIHNDQPGDRSFPANNLLQSDHLPTQHAYSSPGYSENTLSDSGKSEASRDDTVQPPGPSAFTLPFNQISAYGPFPSNLPDLRPWALPAQQVPEQYLGFIGDQYLQYFHAPYVHHQPMRRLSQEEQTELMNSLETNGLYGQNILDEPATFFQDPMYTM